LSAISERLRAQVVARAGNRCEYCHLPTTGQVGRFPVDHVTPRTDGGATELANLALACPACNGHKWAHVQARDSVSDQQVPLFNPPTQRWDDHFHWSTANPFELEGRTPIGRATIVRLQMNDPNMLAIRRLLEQLGVSWQ
jgi:hypothetical protein